MFKIFPQNIFLVLLRRFLVLMLLILNHTILCYKGLYYIMLRGVFQSPAIVLEPNGNFCIFSEEL